MNTPISDNDEALTRSNSTAIGTVKQVIAFSLSAQVDGRTDETYFLHHKISNLTFF